MHRAEPAGRRAVVVLAGDRRLGDRRHDGHCRGRGATTFVGTWWTLLRRMIPAEQPDGNAQGTIANGVVAPANPLRYPAGSVRSAPPCPAASPSPP